ncbi:MAG: DUF1501 domain-containing protein [Planctomycetia bacterium]|nr:DUF1501 domain-containing protein [Planctomycetia bacterium]
MSNESGRLPGANGPHRHARGLTRREVVQVGYSGLLGVGLQSLFAKPLRAANRNRARGAATKSTKSVIIVYLTGAPSHHDTFDMKPEAPAEIRGEFETIAASTPGLHVCEHLPLLAAQAHRYSIVRSLSHGENNHLVATHHVLTGNKQPGAFFDKVASRDDFPGYASACDYFHPRNDGIPTGVNLPTFLKEGPLTWPGQHAGFLGARHDPWQITRDPNKPDFRVDALQLPQGIDVSRLENRRALLDEVNRQRQGLDEAAEARRLSDEQQLAFTMLTSSKIAQAFEMHRESNTVRDRYGRHSFGQSLLLARRLRQAGVPVVQVNMGNVQNWDNHGDIFPTLKKRLLPPFDQGAAALLDDLGESGLLEDTLVMLLGEFGRTPKLNSPPKQKAGRDHWAPCFFGLFAGAGVRGGQVIGKSDDIGAYPVTMPYSPDDVGATVLSLLGVDPGVDVHDRLGRPVQLNRGSVIEPLFTGAIS